MYPLETVAALLDVTGVQDAIVIEDGGTAVVAYVADPDATVDLGRPRQHLVTQLPGYLIPDRVELLRRPPLTLDGQHDLAALVTGPVTASAQVSGSILDGS